MRIAIFRGFLGFVNSPGHGRPFAPAPSGVAQATESRKKSEPRFRGSAKLQPKWAADPRYFTCALSAAISASLRNVIAPIWLSR